MATKKRKAGKRSSKTLPGVTKANLRQLSDYGNPTLAARHGLRLELIDGGAKVRARVTDSDELTRLYWAGQINDIQYSVGISFQADLWKANQTGVKAVNLDGVGGGSQLGGLPPGISSMRRVSRAVDYILRVTGPDGLNAVLEAVGASSKHLSEVTVAFMVVPALNALTRFYEGRSPMGAMRAALGPMEG